MPACTTDTNAAADATYTCNFFICHIGIVSACAPSWKNVGVTADVCLLYNFYTKLPLMLHIHVVQQVTIIECLRCRFYLSNIDQSDGHGTCVPICSLHRSIILIVGRVIQVVMLQFKDAIQLVHNKMLTILVFEVKDTDLDQNGEVTACSYRNYTDSWECDTSGNIAQFKNAIQLGHNQMLTILIVLSLMDTTLMEKYLNYTV